MHDCAHRKKKHWWILILNDDHTLSSQGHLHRINLLVAVLSFVEKLVGDGGCVLRDVSGGFDVYSKPRLKRTFQ